MSTLIAGSSLAYDLEQYHNGNYSENFFVNRTTGLCLGVNEAGDLVTDYCTDALDMRLRFKSRKYDTSYLGDSGQALIIEILDAPVPYSCLHAQTSDTGSAVKAGICEISNVKGYEVIDNFDKKYAFYMNDNEQILNYYIDTFVGDGLGLESHLCLEPEGVAPGSKVRLNDCHEGFSQKWEATYWMLPVTVQQISTPYTGVAQLSIGAYEYGHEDLCRERPCVSRYEKDRTARVEVKAVSPGEAQFDRWTRGPCAGSTNSMCSFKARAPFHLAFQMRAPDTITPPDYFRLRHVSSNSCATLQNGVVSVQPCNLEVGQVWNYQVQPGRAEGSVQLTGSTQCIFDVTGEVSGNYGYHDGFGVTFALCNSSPSVGGNDWLLSTNGEIRITHPGFCLSSDGQSIFYRRCSGDSADQWVLDPHSGAISVMLQSRTSGRCMDNKGASSKGELVHQWACNKNDINQRFILAPVESQSGYYNLVSERSGACLIVDNANTGNGTPVRQWDCDAGTHKLWKKTGANWFSLESALPGKCLDLSGGGLGDGTQFQLWDCVPGHPNQLYRFAANLPDNEIASWFDFQQSQIRPGIRTLQVRHSGKCLDNTNSANQGAVMHQWNCSPTNVNQQFEIVDAGGGDFRIKSKRSGMCLDVKGQSQNNGADVHQWACHGGASQKWWFNDMGNGWREIRPRHSTSLCLDNRGPSLDNGAKFQVWQCVGVAQQQFRELR